MRIGLTKSASLSIKKYKWATRERLNYRIMRNATARALTHCPQAPSRRSRTLGRGSSSSFLLLKPSCFSPTNAYSNQFYCYLIIYNCFWCFRKTESLFSRWICLSFFSLFLGSSIHPLSIIPFLSLIFNFFIIIAYCVYFLSCSGNILRTALACPYSDMDHVLGCH